MHYFQVVSFTACPSRCAKRYVNTLLSRCLENTLQGKIEKKSRLVWKSWVCLWVVVTEQARFLTLTSVDLCAPCCLITPRTASRYPRRRRSTSAARRALDRVHTAAIHLGIMQGPGCTQAGPRLIGIQYSK